MVILTAKLNKGKLLAALLILAVLIAATILICSGGQPDAAAPADNLRASNNDERVAFLASFGWTVQADPVKMQQVRIPDTASEVFDRYNQLQQSQGFDLAQYAGKTVQHKSIPMFLKKSPHFCLFPVPTLAQGFQSQYSTEFANLYGRCQKRKRIAKIF